MTSFNDALRMREAIRGFVREEVAILRPPEALAVVSTVNPTTPSCTVLYAGDTTPVAVKVEQECVPWYVGQVVRIGGPASARRVVGLVTNEPQPWVPTLTGAVGTFSGKYWVDGPTVHIHGLFIATAAGSGQYFFSLPVTAASHGTTNFPLGPMFTYKNATGNIYFGQVWLTSSTSIGFAYTDTAGVSGNWGNVQAGFPHVFASDTDIRFSAKYQAA